MASIRLKLDENLNERCAKLLRSFGHDVATVPEQNLMSADDHTIIHVCQVESRCLVSLDLDFSNPLIFNPRHYAGIAVLRLPRRPTPVDLEQAIQTLGKSLEKESIVGQLWIVQQGRLRVHQFDSEV